MRHLRGCWTSAVVLVVAAVLLLLVATNCVVAAKVTTSDDGRDPFFPDSFLVTHQVDCMPGPHLSTSDCTQFIVFNASFDLELRMEDPWQGLTILNKPQTTLYLRESKFIFDFNSTDFWNKRWNVYMAYKSPTLGFFALNLTALTKRDANGDYRDFLVETKVSDKRWSLSAPSDTLPCPGYPLTSNRKMYYLPIRANFIGPL